MTTMTKKAKMILGSAGGCLLALAVVLAVWQPWKRPEEDDVVPPAVTDPTDQLGQPQEEPLTLTVGGEKIPCTLYEGDGWSIYVPEGWTAEGGEHGGVFALKQNGGEPARIEVIRSAPGAFSGAFTAMSPQRLSDTEEQLRRIFYSGTPESAWEVRCLAPKEDWDGCQRLMTALARTLTVGEERPFATISPVASEPEWQIAEGKTVLWMDKDGYVVNDEAERAVEAEMGSWETEWKEHFTGKYLLEDPEWACSYTCLTDGYIDVFRIGVRYKTADGGEESILAAPGGWTVADGWVRPGEELYLAVFHDGGGVEKTERFVTDLSGGWVGFASGLVGSSSGSVGAP